MLRASKQTSTQFGMAFIFLSLAIAPASLKIAGYTPNLSGIAQVWRQVGNVFGLTYQPVSESELSALNSIETQAPAEATDEATCDKQYVARLSESPADEVASAAGPAIYETSQPRTAAGRASCPKAKSTPAGRTISVEAVELPARTISAARFDVKGFTFTTPQGGEVVLKLEDLDLTEHKAELREALKVVPTIKDGKLQIKVPVPGFVVTPKLTDCNRRTRAAAEQREALKVRAANTWFGGFTDITLTGPDHGEL